MMIFMICLCTFCHLNSALCVDLDFKKGAFIENQMLALYKWLLMLQYQLDQLDMGFFFSTTLGKKYTGHHP